MTCGVKKPIRTNKPPFNYAAAGLLLLIVVSNLVLPQFASHWRLVLPEHTHLFIGPVQPNWLDHHHTHANGVTHTPLPSLPAGLEKFAQNGVISLYTMPGQDGYLLSIGAPFVLPDAANYLRPSADLISQIMIVIALPTQIYLPLLDKPPADPLF